MNLVSVILPAYRAEGFLLRAVKSLESQTYPYWEAIIVADDKADYAAVLKRQGIESERLKFFATTAPKSGASAARNVGLKNASGDIIALLDADDAFMPEKLAYAVPKVKQHGLFSCALAIFDSKENHLRNAGDKGKEGPCPAAGYKKISISTESMLVFDRRKIPAAYDETKPCLNDLDFLFRCFEYVEHIYYTPKVLHRYYKQLGSISNSAYSHSSYMQEKQQLLKQVSEGVYRFKDKEALPAMQHFLEVSMEAEKQFEAALSEGSGVLFEDVIEKII